MRFAGEEFNKYTGDSDVSDHGAAWQRSHQLMQQKPVVPGFNTEDLAPTPELPAGNPFNQHHKGNYILNNPASGISMLPGGVQGPAQGPNIPIKNYGGVFMPDGTQPTGYRPGPRRV